MRIRMVRVLIAAACAGASIFMAQAGPAAADGGGTVSITAGYSPGLTIVPTDQVGSMSGTMSGVFHGVAGSCTIGSTASAFPNATILTASGGSGAFTCAGTVTVTCSTLSMSTTPGSLSLSGTCTINGVTHTLTVTVVGTYAPAGGPFTSFSGTGVFTA